EIYRDLRKGLEEAKNEPGAADFYYGEMEMRRLAGRKPTGGNTASRRIAPSWAERVEDVPSSVELRWQPGEHQAALT
ncbi:MAG: hypothetical protein WAO15_13855, partial [Mycobacterium sp.]